MRTQPTHLGFVALPFEVRRDWLERKAALVHPRA